MTRQGLARHAPKRDENEKDIVAALTLVGATVQPISAKGCPDLLVGWKNPGGERRTLLFEVKMPGKHLNENQVEWHNWWQGEGAYVVYSPEEAVIILGRLVEEDLMTKYLEKQREAHDRKRPKRT